MSLLGLGCLQAQYVASFKDIVFIFVKFFFRDCRSFTSRKNTVIFQSIPVDLPSSLRSWRGFARESFCFGSEAVNRSGEAVGGLVKSRVEFAAREFPRGLRQGGNMLCRSPAHESRQLRRLSPEWVLARFMEGVPPVGELALVCCFGAFSDFLLTMQRIFSQHIC